MSHISIEVTNAEHEQLKARAAQNGQSVKEYVIERALGTGDDKSQQAASQELEALLDERIHSAKDGAVSHRTVNDIFQDAYRGTKRN